MPFTASLDGETVIISSFNEVDRGRNFRCKLCDEKMTLVFSNVYSNHFRHLVSSCENYETMEHLMMKKYIYDWLSEFGFSCELEEINIDENGKKNIIDVAAYRGKNKIAIECQHSKIVVSKAKNRTRLLNKKGYFVLWILDRLSFSSQKVTDLEKFLHRIYYGKVYYLLHKNLRPIHFRKVERHNEYIGYTYYLKKIRKRILGDVIEKPYFVLKTVTDIKTKKKYKIAMFNDKKFW